MTEQEIRALFEKHKAPLGQKDVWHVQQQPVIKHSALERLAVAINIQWVKVEVIRNERDEAVVLVYGKRGDKDYVEFSFGEAVIGLNYRVSGKQAAYPWAMAEKRAKDRVIIKLADLHGAYSSEDTFEMDEPAQVQKPSPVEVVKGPTEAQAYVSLAKTSINNASSAKELDQWWMDESANRKKHGIEGGKDKATGEISGTPEYLDLVKAFSKAKAELMKEAA